jgi:ELWxxDGT repeat protein
MHLLKTLSARILSLCAASAFVAPASLAQTFNNPNPIFSDAANHWASACIEGVGNEGLMTGYLDGRFLPDGTMTRAEFAAVMVKAFPNAQTIRDEPNFSDVAADFWGKGAIASAYERGFLAGYPGNVFKPAQPITRAQAIVVMANTQQLMLAENGPQDSGLVLRSFLQDWRQVPEWGSDAIAAAIQKGIVVNYPKANQLRPSDSITRAEATALLCRSNASGTDARYYVPAQYVATFIDPPELNLLGEFPREFGSLLFQKAVLNNQMLFSGDNNETAELWTTDGTVVGTQRIRDLQMVLPGGREIRATSAELSILYAETTDAENQTATELWIRTQQAFRQANQPDSLPAGIWHSDGTAEGTVPIALLNEELLRSLQTANYWTGLSSRLFKGRIPFMIQRPDSLQIWLTDGKTEAGTDQLLQIPNAYSGAQRTNSDPTIFMITDSHLFFAMSEGEVTTIWRSDGSTAGTEQVMTIPSRVYSFRQVNGQVYFSLETPEQGQELWTSDGTQSGTRLVADFLPGSESSKAEAIWATGETTYILANSEAGTGLWALDKTASSPRLVKQLKSVATYTGDAIATENDGKLFFAVPTSLPPSAPPSSVERQIYEPTYELWVSDGTAAGTTQLGSPIKSFFTDFTAFNGRLFFNGNGPNGQELWVSDGTVAGTRQVVDLAPGSSPYSPNCPTQSAPTGAKKQQAQSNPALACEFYEVANSSSPRSLTVRGDFLYFVAGDRDLYRTDGTALGTQFIQRLRGDGGPYSPEITPLGNRLLVTGYVGDSDRPQLWAVLEQVIPVLSGYP